MYTVKYTKYRDMATCQTMIVHERREKPHTTLSYHCIVFENKVFIVYNHHCTATISYVKHYINPII